jgi:hypothetical protein
MGNSRRRLEAVHVFRRHRGVVDHRARGLHPGLGGLRHHVIDGGRRHLGNGRDIVQKCQQSAHDLVTP